MNLQAAVDNFTKNVKANGRALTTVGWYERSLCRLVDHLGANAPIAEVSRDDLRDYVVHLRDQGYADATVAGLVTAVKVFFNWLVAEGKLKESPAASLKRPRPNKCAAGKEIRPETLARLLRAATRARDYTMLIFMAQTGVRKGELLRLKWQDIDFNDGSVYVTGKGNKIRYVPFGERAQEALLFLKKLHPGGDHVFCNWSSGEPLSTDGLKDIFARLKERAGINGERCNPHSFRHYFASEYLRNGGDLASLAEILGHEDASLTAEVYVHLLKKDLKEKHSKYAPSLDFDDGV